MSGSTRRRVLMCALTSVILLGPAVPGVADSAPTASQSTPSASPISPASPTSPRDDATDDPGTADLGVLVPTARITSVGDPLLTAGQDLEVRAEVMNPLDEPVTVSGISLLGQDWTPDTRSRVLRFLEGGPAALSLLQHIDEPRVIPAGESASFEFTVARDSLGWSDSFDEWGPRGIEIEADLDDGTQLTDRSIAIVSPGTELTPMPTGAVVPITRSAATLAAYPDLADTLESPEPGADSTTPPAVDPTAAGVAATDMSALEIPGVTIALDPSMLSKSSGSTGSAEAVEAAMDSFVQSPGTELLFTTWNDVDSQPLIHAGALDKVADAYARSETAAAETAARQGSKPRTDIAVLPAGADQETAAALTSLGVSGVILPDNDVPQDEYRYATASARTTLALEVDGEYSALPGLAVDSVSSAALSGVLTSSEEGAGEGARLTTSLDALDSRQLVLALSAVTYRERPSDSRAMLLSLDRAGLAYHGSSSGAPQGTENVADTLEALMNAPWVEPSTVSELMSLDPSDTSRMPLPLLNSSDAAMSQSQITSLQASLSAIENFANLSPTPALLIDPTREEIGRTSAIAWRASPDGRERQVNKIEGAAQALSTALQVRPSSTINIISQATELPIHVSNELAVPVGVVIQLDSHDNRLEQKGRVTVTLPPNQVSNVSIPVTARGSGNIQVVIRILDPTGHEIGTNRTLEIRVRADWENMGTLIIAIGLGVVLIFGVVKSLRRGRKRVPVDPAEYARARRESSHRSRQHKN